MEKREPSCRATARGRGTQKRTKRTTYTVGFRLDEHYLSLLERGAAESGLSIHVFARQRLIDHLERYDELQLLAEAAHTRAAVSELREDVARMLEVLLANLTSASPDAIRAWVAQNLRRD